MNQFPVLDELRAVAVAVAVTVLFLVIAHSAVRLVLIRLGWITGTVRVPWRVSLFAIVVLTVFAAGVFAIFRDVPALAALALAAVVLVWMPIARFLEFRRSVAERSNRQLESLAQEQLSGDAGRRQRTE